MRKFFFAIAFGASIFGQPRIARADGSIDAVATQVAAALKPSQQALLVVAAPLVTDMATPHGDELAVRLATIVAGKLGTAAHAHVHTASLATARALAGHSAGLVFVSAQIEKGQLRATVDSYPVVANAWDRVRVAAPAPRAHGFASAPLDAEIRTFLPVITLEQAQVHKAHHDEIEVLAAACGASIDGGGLQIALVSRSRISIGTVRGKVGEQQFVTERSKNFSVLGSRVATPLRDPLGGVAFAEDGTLFVGTTDRGGMALDSKLEFLTALPGIPVAGTGHVACARVDAGSSGFSGDPKACSALPSSPATLVAPAAKYDALAFADVVDKHGVAHHVAVARGADGKLIARVGSASRSFDEVGAQVAVGDLDQDGVPEIVTTRNAIDDAIDVWSYDGTTTRERKKIPAPAGVSALAVCPPEVNGASALVAVVGSEVWIVR